MHQLLTSEKALIFRIIHRDNLGWVLKNGLHCAASQVRDPNFIPIGSPDLIVKRTVRAIPHPPGGTLSNYVPFYFTPRSPMLFNIKTGYNGIRQRSSDEILFLVTSLSQLAKNNVQFLFTDRHAYLQAAQFSNRIQDLNRIDWRILQNSDFKRDNNDLGKMERYQAEALAFNHVPSSALIGVACYTQRVKDEIGPVLAGGILEGKAYAQPRWYF